MLNSYVNLLFSYFQKQEVWPEPGSRKTQNLYVERFGWSDFDKYWHDGSFRDALRNDNSKIKKGRGKGVSILHAQITTD